MTLKKNMIPKLVLALAALALTAPAVGFAQACVPSCDEKDGRHLAITPGTGLDTLVGERLDLTIGVDAAQPNFVVGFFDGETGGLWDLEVAPIGVATLTFTLYTDPDRDGCNPAADCGPGQVVTTFDGESMLDNDWSDFIVANDAGALNAGRYTYILRSELDCDGPPVCGAPIRNGFKVRGGTDDDVSIEVFDQPFSYITSLPNFAELGIIYPACANGGFPGCLGDLSNTTYDGTFSFFVSYDDPQCEFIVWDGDFDHGSFDGSVLDDDDPNTVAGLAGLPPWACEDPTIPCAAGTNPPLEVINFEDQALGLCLGGSEAGNSCIMSPPGSQPFVPFCPGGTCGVTGNPPDDFNALASGGLGAIFVRSPSLSYEVYAPDGTFLGTNFNPSGNQEWELFRLAIPGGGCYLDENGLPPEVDVAALPAGTYEVRVVGLDLENLNAIRFAGRSVPEDCSAECVGGVTEMTLDYTGTLSNPDPIVRVEQTNGDVLFDGAIPAGGRLSITGTAPDSTMGPGIKVFVNGVLNAEIQTDCGVAIFPGITQGDFEIIEVRSRDNGLICPDIGCLPDLDFEIDPNGTPLTTGQIVDDEFASYGITITTDDPVNHPAMIFNTASPTGGDYDLGTPNETFGGPGIGSGGEVGQPGENSVGLGKVLIISEDGDSSDPDDNAGGGTIIATFDEPVRVDAVQILDIDEGLGGTVKAFDCSGSQIGAGAMSNLLGNNSYQEVAVGVIGVCRLEVFFPGSGALAGVLFCVDESACADKTVRDDFNNDSFSNNDGPDEWSGDWIEDDVAGAGPTTGNVKVWGGALKLRDKPDTGTHPSAAREVDLSGSDFASVFFKYDTSAGVDTSDAVVFEVSHDGGSSWTTLETFTGIYGATWGERTFDISGFISSDTQVRFRVTNLYGGSDEWFFVTELEVRGRCTSTCEPVAVEDHFGGDSYSNNDGPDDWSAPWHEYDVAGAGPTAGNVKSWGGMLMLRDKPDTGTHPSAARTVDIAGTTSATLSFDFWTTNGVDTSDAVVVEISSNGGMTYTVLETFTGIHGWSDGWRSYDISGFIASDTTVRFRVTNLYGGSDEWFKVDNLKIEAACD